ncbi:zinc finger protein 236-like [Eupeodes corollae]|uniref:zinc finger protein 236-like n=1 Tax=Eupeodes corollae TaxID=290404 RepID=UPI002492C993|nr:zinc finger protein 236-like [Eupeodes corollae]
MVCRLCLNKDNENIFLFSEEKILKCITRFLQLELTADDPVSKVICADCWQHLDDFQKFCLQIEEAQKSLKSSADNVVEEARKEFVKDLSPVKEEEQAEESIEDAYDNVDTLNCMDEDTSIFKVDDDKKVTLPLITDSSETDKCIPMRRVTRQRSNLPPEKIKQKRKRSKKKEIKEDESSEEDEEENSDSRKRSKSKKCEENSQEDKEEGRSEKFLKNMKTTKENDAFIQKHMKLRCDICTIILPDFTKLKHHFRVVHQRRGYVMCCNRQLKKRSLIVDHIYVHNDPEYFKCTECGKILSDRSCLQRHNILCHQAEELKTFQCNHCPKKFPTKKLLDLHTVHHNECTFMCSECGKGFPTKSTMNVHFKRIHSTLCDRMCEICAKLIKGKTAFERHMEEHEGIVQPRVQCKECGSWLKDKNSLRKHMYSKHDGKTHDCKICGKNTPSYSALYSHMKYMHELAAMFHCTFCDKSFKRAIKLKEHVATHTGGFLYTCPHCPTTFNAKTNMHSHRKKMHREEWEASRRYAKKAPGTIVEEISNEKKGMSIEILERSKSKICFACKSNFHKFTMVCRLCLNDTGQSIFIFSEENIQKCIARFLQLELSPEDPISKQICCLCWQQLDNFQKFCFQIEEAQKTLLIKINDVPKPQIIQSDNEQPLPQPEIISFETFNPEISLNLLKEESIEDSRFDDNSDIDEPLFCLKEDKVKVELHTEEELKPATLVNPPAVESISSQRITRRSTTNHQYAENNDTAEISPGKRKSTRNKKDEFEKVKTKEEDDEEEEDQESDKDAFETSTFDVDSNAKRKRGRPKKGEKVTPKKKVPTVKSEKCSKIFQTAREFDVIIKKHMSLSCDVCYVKFVDFAELKRHFRNVHKSRGYAVCCNKKLFKRGLVVDHINVHNNPEHFKCPKCDKVLADRMCLRNHDLLFHQAEESLIYQCEHCPDKFAKKYLLDHHNVKHIRKDKSKLTCPTCGNGFLTESTLTKHIQKVHSTDYDNICEICAKIVRGNAAFERHMKEHEGVVQPRFQCNICGMWLKTKRILVKHIEKHDGITYPCKICGKHSASKGALQSHMSYVHDLSRKYSCTLCEKSFKKAVALKEHMTTHTGEVLYTCPHCPTTFNSRANMHSHRKKKHREEWEANRILLKKALLEKPQET